MKKTYNVVATDNKYYCTDGESIDVVWKNIPLNFAKKEAARIRKANVWGTAWVEDQEGNVIK